MKKKFAAYYVIQAITALCIQLPISLNWLSWQPDKIKLIATVFAFDYFTLVTIGIILVHVYTYFIEKKHVVLFFCIAFVLIFSSPTLYLVISNFLKWLLWPEGYNPVTWAYIRKVTPSYFEGYLIFTVVFLVTYYWREYKNQREKTMKAVLLANEAQLKMLQYQINPHFLFNTITSVLSLIDENKNKAKEVLMNFSEYFRYTLNNKEGGNVEISKEIGAIKKYLEIQKIRFEGKIRIQYKIDSKAGRVKIPFFLIHPLVENAVKYGIRTSPLPLRIKIEITKQKSRGLQIHVINSGKLIPPVSDEHNKAGTSTGIQNLQKRMEIVYGEKTSFSLSEKDGYVHASITLLHDIR